jgi:hypothetical protein
MILSIPLSHISHTFPTTLTSFNRHLNFSPHSHFSITGWKEEKEISTEEVGERGIRWNSGKRERIDYTSFFDRKEID